MYEYLNPPWPTQLWGFMVGQSFSAQFLLTIPYLFDKLVLQLDLIGSKAWATKPLRGMSSFGATM